MEAPNDDYSTTECSPWGDNDLYLDPAFWDDTGALLSNILAPDILDSTSDLAPDMQFNEFDLNQLPWSPWELINDTYHMNQTPELTSMTATSLASSRGDSVWSPSPGESAFTSPLVSVATPSLTLDPLLLLSPQSNLSPFSCFPMGATAHLTDNVDSITDYITQASVLTEVQETQTAATPRLTMDDLPRGMNSFVSPSRYKHVQTLKLT